MLTAARMSDIARAIREGRNKATQGGAVVVDDVFSKSDELAGIASRAAENGVSSPVGEQYTGSVVEPTEALTTGSTAVAHYRFDDALGTEAADDSINDNDLTLTGGSWGAGKFGNGLSLDGSDDVATVTAVSVEPLRNYLHVSVWVKPTSLTGTRPICKLADRFLLYFDAGVLKCAVIDGATTYTVSSALTATTDVFQFVTMQYTNGTVSLALGDLVYQETIAATRFAEEYPAAGKTLTVGSDGTNFFAGVLDELLIDANVRVVDDFPITKDVVGPNDVIMWPFNDGSGSKVCSTRLFGETLALTGGTWGDGRTRNAVEFDGVDDFGVCTPQGETFTGRTLSVEIGVKFATTDPCPLITQSGGINLSFDGTGIVAALGGVTNPTTIVGLLTPQVGSWYNLCIVYDGSAKELWVNGQKFGQIACSGTALLSTNPLYVARDGDTYANISVDRIRIYRARLRPFYRNVPYFVPGIHGFTAVDEWIVKS